MLNEKEFIFKKKILKETDAKKINEILISGEIDNFIGLFSDNEFMEHLQKYFKMNEDEAVKHIYIRKKVVKEYDKYTK